MNTEERRRHIERLRQLPGQLAEVLRELSDTDVDTPYRPGGWTIRQVVHHLADAHMNGYVRMKLILTEDAPTLKAYDQNEWAKLPDVAVTPVASSLELLYALHDRWCILLERVDEAGWKRTGIHGERGLLTLEDLLRIYTEHGEKHLGHLRGMREGAR